MSQAYHRNMFFPNFLLLTTGWNSRYWWRKEQANLTCTPDQREKVIFYALAVTQLNFLEDEDNDSLSTTPGIVCEYQ